ncbi:hypothetical protein PZB74_21035 [Porifericola rhodea]|uniref:hypothetical protein n=1 Tax=Porifericola rhodea TaxID=930972 RepID=UPI002666BF9B|nr:hypothetical protein [Porifericola rhodea]WKN31439.1 hypothetical protein PZB74_21035 [Porifericola rhodea]
MSEVATKAGVASLKKWYLITITTLMLMMVLMHVLSSKIIYKTNKSTDFIELIAQQEALSQRMLKLVLLTDRGNAEPALSQLSTLNEKWTENSFQLKSLLSSEVADGEATQAALCQKVDTQQKEISEIIKEFLVVAHVNELRGQMIQKLFVNEDSFLEATAQLTAIHRTEAKEGANLLNQVTLLIVIFASALTFILYRLHNASIRNMKVMLSIDDDMPQSTTRAITTSDFSTDLENHSAHTKVLVIKDQHMPVDYVAWYLNKWSIDFKVAKDLDTAEAMAGLEKFDVLLYNQLAEKRQDGKPLLNNYFHISQLPQVELDETDTWEIHAQIYEEAEQNTPGKLFDKIKAQIPQEKVK